MRPSPQVVHAVKPLPPILDEKYTNEDVFADIDHAFEKIQIRGKSKTSKIAKARRMKADLGITQMRRTFLAVSRVHLSPATRYLKAIERGVASKDICQILEYVVGPMISKTRKAGLEKQTLALVAFQRTIKKAVTNTSRKLSVEYRSNLSQTFGAVKETFKLEFRGHSTAVVNLLGFSRVLHRNKQLSQGDIKKIFAIGIPSLTMLRKSSIEELSSLSGLPAEKISIIRSIAREYSPLELV